MSPSSSISTKTDFQSASEAPQAQDSHSTAASLHVGKRSLSWPGSLPCSQEKMPTSSDSFKPITAAPSMSDKASFRAQTMISSPTQPAPVSLQATSPLSTNSSWDPLHLPACSFSGTWSSTADAHPHPDHAASRTGQPSSHTSNVRTSSASYPKPCTRTQHAACCSTAHQRQKYQRKNHPNHRTFHLWQSPLPSLRW